MSGKRNLGRIVTLLVLFLLTVVVVLIIYAYFTGLISLTPRGSPSVKVTGLLDLDQNNASAATLAFSVSNTGGTSITGVAFTCPTSDFALAKCGNLVLTDSSGPVSISNPLTKGQTAGASGLVALASGANVTPGMQIIATARVTFAGGSTSSYAVVVSTYV